MANSAFSSGNLSNITIPETLPIGSIIPYPGATAPTNWLLCYGQVLSRTTYPNLYTAVGDYAVADAQLTTRTDNDTGVITIVGGNRGLTTSETLNVYWSGGSRTGMTITNVTGATVTVDGGSGDNLPNNLTLVWCSIAASKFFNYDFRGRSPIGLDSMGGTSANRVAAAWADTMGQYGGEENHTLSEAELASHSHTENFSDGAGGQATYVSGGGGGGGSAGISQNYGSLYYSTVNTANGSAGGTGGNGGSAGTAGSNGNTPSDQTSPGIGGIGGTGGGGGGGCGGYSSGWRQGGAGGNGGTGGKGGPGYCCVMWLASS